MSRQKILAVAVGLSLAGCGPKVASIDVSPKSISLSAKGGTAKLVAAPKDAENKAVDGVVLTFTSSDPAVASVDANGTVKAEKSGDAKIKVAFEDKVTVEVPAKVSIPASISVTPADVKLNVGEKSPRIVVKVLDDKGRETTAAVTWENPNPEVATVMNGEVTAVGAGTTKISAVAAGIKSPVTVTVTAPVVASIDVPKTMEVKTGDKPTKIAVTAKEADGKPIPGAVFTYKSANEKIVTVNAAGEVTGVAKGKAKVDVATGGKNGSVEITVKPGAPGAPAAVAPKAAEPVKPVFKGPKKK